MENAMWVDIRNSTVRKANDLIQKSRFNLTLQQQKIMLYLISQISPDDEEFKLYEFSIPDFCRACGIVLDSGKNYGDLKAAMKEIRDKSAWILLPNGTEVLVAWIAKVIIDRGSGTIRVRLDDDLKPFLLQLKENYTQYELIFTLHFRSKYTIRLYELIKSLHYHELQPYVRRYPIDELRKRLDAEIYPQYRNFKQRVLQPAVAEINQYSDKTVSTEEIRHGRKVVAVQFTICSKDSLETLRIRDGIDKEMGLLPGQMSLWDEIQSSEGWLEDN